MWWKAAGGDVLHNDGLPRYPSRSCATENIALDSAVRSTPVFYAFQRGCERPSVLETGLKFAW